MIFVFLIAVLPIATPLWTAAWIVPILRRLVEPGFRADLAVTPTDPAALLRGELRSAINASAIPAAVGAIAAALFLVGWLIEGPSGGGHYDGLGQLITLFGFLCGAMTVFGNSIACGSLWVSALRACEKGTSLQPLMATTAAAMRVGAGIVVQVVLVWGTLMILELGGLKPTKTELLFGFTIVAMTVALCVVAHRRQVRSWNQLVSAYLDVDPIRGPKRGTRAL